MKLDIDGKVFETQERQSILVALKVLGYESDSLRDRPLAAKIGGEIFSLQYAPKTDCSIHLLRYHEDLGRRVYERTLEFTMILCIRRLFPKAKVRVRYSLGPGLYMSVENGAEVFNESCVLQLEGEMRRLVRQALPLERKRIPIEEALAFYEADGQTDKANLLKWRKFNYFDVYQADGYMDYFYGEMTPDTSYVDIFRLKFVKDNELIMLLPRNDAPDVPSDYLMLPKLNRVLRQSDEWGMLMECATVNELNVRIKNGSIRELIRVNEALHARAYSDLADQIIARKAQVVMVAGPSSSGKTTSAYRIATQLRVMGFNPQLVSLDDYYIDREKTLKGPDGEQDLESIYALDIPRLHHDLELLLNGKEAEIPKFNFQTERREKEGRTIQLHENQQLIIEGIHGLNPLMISKKVDESQVFRVYVSALTTLNLDDHNRIRATDIRLLRRLVRDYETRDASMEETLGMWHKVRQGEEKWIFPYQENADILLNTSLVYEAAVLKKYVYPLLSNVPNASPYYAQARDIVKFLNYFLEADVEDEIPPTSLLREFIGGNTYYK